MAKQFHERRSQIRMIRLFLLFSFSFGFSQFNRLGINPDNAQPDPSAILDVDVGSGPAKGVLIPRLTDAQRDQLAAVEGLLIFNTTTNHLNYFDGTQWIQIDTVQAHGVIPPGGTNGGYGVAVSPTGVSPLDAALLDVFGTTGGLLLPRLTTAQRDAISNPAEGLLIYNVTTKQLNYYDGTGWKRLCGTPVSTTTGGVTASDGLCISTSGAARNPVAILEINGTEGGLLIPRVSVVGRDTIKSPPVGLWIYNTTVKRYEIYGGGDTWIVMDEANSCPPSALACFDSAYGGSGTEDWPHGIVQMSDGSYYVAGYSTSFSPDQDIWLAKLDANGKKLWEKVYPINGNDYVLGLIHTSDNQLLISGYTGTAGAYDILLLKVQLDGTITWAKKYDLGGSNDYGRGVIEDGNGDYVVAFRTNKADSKYDVGLLKVNNSGGVIWAEYFPNNAVLEWTWGLTLIPPTTYVLGAYSGPDFNSYDPLIIKVDGAGTPIWEKKLSGGLGERVFSIKATPSGKLILGGATYISTTNSRIFAIQLDGNTGNLIWEKQYHDPTIDTGYTVYSVINTSDGNHLLVGYASSIASGANVDELIALKIDSSSGNIIWIKQFGDGSNSGNTERGYNAIVTQDNKILITGISSTYSSGGKDFWFLKIDNNGNGPTCNSTPTLNSNLIGLTSSPLSISPMPLSPTTTNLSISPTPVSSTQSAGCGCN